MSPKNSHLSRGEFLIQDKIQMPLVSLYPYVLCSTINTQHAGNCTTLLATWKSSHLKTIALLKRYKLVENTDPGSKGAWIESLLTPLLQPHLTADHSKDRFTWICLKLFLALTTSFKDTRWTQIYVKFSNLNNVKNSLRWKVSVVLQYARIKCQNTAGLLAELMGKCSFLITYDPLFKVENAVKMSHFNHLALA